MATAMPTTGKAVDGRSEPVVYVGLILMLAGWGVHLTWTRLAKRALRSVAFWDD